MKEALKKLATVACVLMLFSVIGVHSQAAEEITLTIIHTNDIHGHPEIYPYLKSYAAQVRAEHDNVILIDAGDTIASTAFARYHKGQAIVELMNMCGYEIYTLGNHEQLEPAANFGAALENAGFVRLGGNVSAQFREAGNIQDYCIKDYNGVKVAFIGVTTGTETERTGDDAAAFVEEARNRAAAEGATVFIAVTHLGVTEADISLRSTYLAQKCPWLDAIIDGHCHSVHQNGLYEGNVLIAETGEYGNNVGSVTLTIAGGSVTGKSAAVIPISDLAVNPDEKALSYIKEVNEALTYLQQVVATFPMALDGDRTVTRVREAALGDIIADAMLYVSDAQIALVPAAFIRASVDPGEMTREQLDNLFISPQTAMTVQKLSGAQIMELLEVSFSGLPEPASVFRQVGGLRIVYDPDARSGSRIVSITLSDGTPLESATVYQVICTDMDFKQIYPDWEENGLTFDACEITLNEAFIQYVNSGEVTTWETDGRMVPMRGA